MHRLDCKQYGFTRLRCWRGSQLWRDRIKIVLFGAQV